MIRLLVLMQENVSIILWGLHLYSEGWKNLNDKIVTVCHKVLSILTCVKSSNSGGAS